jgi:hypothetical protein
MFWLSINIKLSRDGLKEYFNAPTVLEYSDNESITSLFTFIMPSLDNYRSYRFFEWGLISYVVSLICLIASNFYDAYRKADIITGLTLSQQPNFNCYKGFVTSSNLITFIGVLFFFYLFWIICKYLLDIRNIVILLKWFNGSLKPAVHDALLSKNKIFFRNMKPLYEYKRVNSLSDLHFCISLFYIQASEVSNPSLNENPEYKMISGKINLPESLKNFNEKSENSNMSEIPFDVRTKIDSDLNRRLTEEELKMKGFFKSLLINNSYGGNLADEWERL